MPDELNDIIQNFMSDLETKVQAKEKEKIITKVAKFQYCDQWNKGICKALSLQFQQAIPCSEARAIGCAENPVECCHHPKFEVTK